MEIPKGWHIEYDPTPPIPSRNHDWCFWHDDDDGAPDGTQLCGTGASEEDCLEQIEQLEITRAENELANKELLTQAEIDCLLQQPD